MRWYGKIGYAVHVEKPGGVWIDEINELERTGDLIRNNSRWDNNSSVNGKVSLSNKISILSDPYLIGIFQDIRYITFMGTKWCVTDVEVQYPRLILSTGGVYNG